MKADPAYRELTAQELSAVAKWAKGSARNLGCLTKGHPVVGSNSYLRLDDGKVIALGVKFCLPDDAPHPLDELTPLVDDVLGTKSFLILAGELDRLRVAYSTNLARDVEPLSKEAVRDGLALIAAAEKMQAALDRIVNEFDDLNGNECKNGCGKCCRCIAREALE